MSQRWNCKETSSGVEWARAQAIVTASFPALVDTLVANLNVQVAECVLAEDAVTAAQRKFSYQPFNPDVVILAERNSVLSDSVADASNFTPALKTSAIAGRPHASKVANELLVPLSVSGLQKIQPQLSGSPATPALFLARGPLFSLSER